MAAPQSRSSLAQDYLSLHPDFTESGDINYAQLSTSARQDAASLYKAIRAADEFSSSDTPIFEVELIDELEHQNILARVISSHKS